MAQKKRAPRTKERPRNWKIAQFKIRGMTPYMQNAWRPKRFLVISSGDS